MRRITSFVLGMFVFLVLMLACRVPYGFAIETSMEEAVLKGNWEEVSEMLEKDDTRANDPVARLIMGHACLVTNRNNVSMLLFLSVKEEEDLGLWSEWAESLLFRNPQNPIALYLSADAKARTGRLEEALEGFTQALKMKEDFTLAFNARGVVRVLTNDWNNAQVDFYLATQLAPDFADAYANLGTLGVLRETSLDFDKGTLEAFNQALSINPEFALAYNGRGCIYFGSGRFEEAAQDFSIASQLSPILVVAEINQGLASAYASKLITLVNREWKPGTTFKSMNQQYPSTLKEQQQQLLNMLPTQKDQEFWKKMDALPWILQSDEKTQALIKEYGLQKVQMGAFLKIQEFQGQIAESNQKMQTLSRARSLYDRRIWNLRQSEFWTSSGLTALGIGKDVAAAKDTKASWEALMKIELTAGKATISSLAQNRAQELIASALPTTTDPLRYTIGVVSQFGLKTTRYMAEDKLYAIDTELKIASEQSALWSAHLQAINKDLYKLGGIAQPPIIMNSSSQIPGYYTSTDRPLTEIGALASMVDKSIKPMDGSSRRALVVGQDPFRVNLQQQELHKYGFETKVIPPEIDAQSEARRWGANVILGIRGTPEMKAPQIGYVPPLEDPSKKYYDSLWKKVPPPFPPGKGGSAAGIPKMSQPPIKQNWDWGKSFIPTYPKGAPGGISTEELAKSFVDKGSWPVMTSFGLFYMAGSLTEGQNKAGGESR